MFDLKSSKIGIIGLGYVGLPLAVEFGKKYPTVGLDINKQRIDELKSGKDNTCEVDAAELSQARQLTFTAECGDLDDCNVYIVTVPTPIDAYKRPDLTLLENASRTIGKFLTRTVVLNHRNARPSLKQILIRSAARLIPCEPVSFLIGSRTSGWHDELSDTKIVDVSKPPEVLKKALDVRPVARHATRNPRAHP